MNNGAVNSRKKYVFFLTDSDSLALYEAYPHDTTGAILVFQNKTNKQLKSIFTQKSSFVE